MNQNPLLTKAVQEVTGESKAKAEAMIAAVLGSIKKVTTENSKLSIQKYGVFTIKQRAARTCRNPKTDEMINVPAKEIFSFKASK